MVGFVRIALLFAFALFWGGLTFYTGFVVRISHDVLGDPIDGGLITQRVTVVLQNLGWFAAVMMAGNSWMVLRKHRRFGYVLIGCTVVLAGSLAGLVMVHGHLDAVIDVANYEVTDRAAFVVGHRRYNQLTTIEWLSSLIYMLITVYAWQSIDRNAC